jgi:hypothetical protein
MFLPSVILLIVILLNVVAPIEFRQLKNRKNVSTFFRQNFLGTEVGQIFCWTHQLNRLRRPGGKIIKLFTIVVYKSS